MSGAIKVDDYLLTKLLGKGSYGEVYYTTKKGSNIPYATKRMKRAEVENPNYIKYFVNEITILKGLYHKNIARIESLKKTGNHYYIIMEYYDGGTLKENFEKYREKFKTPFPERIVQHIMRQLVEAVNFLHERQIVHRDIKSENILLNYNTKEAKDSLDILHSELKLIDFGTATHKSNENLITTAIGSPLTMDPLILKKYINTSDSNVPYDEKIDIWSLGVTCYQLFTGEIPFKAANFNELINEIEKGFIKIPINISMEAISFLLNMLQYSSAKRFTAENLLNHPFLQKYYGDFTDLDQKMFQNYIKNGYLYVNIKNTDEILSTFNQCINQKKPELSSISFITATNYSNSNQFSMFGGSAPIFKGKMNNFSSQRDSKNFQSVVPNPQISSLILDLMNDSKIKEQELLHNSLAFIYQVNDKIQNNQTCPNFILKKDNEQNNIINNNSINNNSINNNINNNYYNSVVVKSNNNIKTQQNQKVGYHINPQNIPKQNITITSNTSNTNNNYQNSANNNIQSTVKNIQNNLKENKLQKESIQNKTKDLSKIHNSLLNKQVYLSGKYNTTQPQVSYNTTIYKGYNGNIVKNSYYNKNNANYQYNNSFNSNSSAPIQIAKNSNFQ